MRVYGSAAIGDVLGDNVAYRSLQPLDARLPSGQALAAQCGIPANTPLRKGDAGYARVVAALLGAAQQLHAPGVPLERLVLIGDTRMSDGGAFSTICAATGWRGRAFIGADGAGEPALTSTGGFETRSDDITFANRWSLLPEWFAALSHESFVVDHATALVLDLDKTVIGARGRNDRLIDQARLRALEASVADVLGAAFARATFTATYRAIDTAQFHPLTGDNQDYVAYICTIVGSGAVAQPELERMYGDGQVQRFADFLALAGERLRDRNDELLVFHQDIAARVAAGDPTPFKAFRRREYTETAALMGSASSHDAAVLLREELVLTGEVWQVAHACREHGALLFGLSDKPDEAAMPTDEQQRAGMLPLHRMRTHVVGS